MMSKCEAEKKILECLTDLRNNSKEPRHLDEVGNLISENMSLIKNSMKNCESNIQKLCKIDANLIQNILSCIRNREGKSDERFAGIFKKEKKLKKPYDRDLAMKNYRRLSRDLGKRRLKNVLSESSSDKELIVLHKRQPKLKKRLKRHTANLNVNEPLESISFSNVSLGYTIEGKRNKTVDKKFRTQKTERHKRDKGQMSKELKNSNNNIITNLQSVTSVGKVGKTGKQNVNLDSSLVSELDTAMNLSNKIVKQLNLISEKDEGQGNINCNVGITGSPCVGVDVNSSKAKVETHKSSVGDASLLHSPKNDAKKSEAKKTTRDSKQSIIVEKSDSKKSVKKGNSNLLNGLKSIVKIKSGGDNSGAELSMSKRRSKKIEVKEHSVAGDSKAISISSKSTTEIGKKTKEIKLKNKISEGSEVFTDKTEVSRRRRRKCKRKEIENNTSGDVTEDKTDEIAGDESVREETKCRCNLQRSGKTKQSLVNPSLERKGLVTGTAVMESVKGKKCACVTKVKECLKDLAEPDGMKYVLDSNIKVKRDDKSAWHNSKRSAQRINFVLSNPKLTADRSKIKFKLIETKSSCVNRRRTVLERSIVKGISVEDRALPDRLVDDNAMRFGHDNVDNRDAYPKANNYRIVPGPCQARGGNEINRSFNKKLSRNVKELGSAERAEVVYKTECSACSNKFVFKRPQIHRLNCFTGKHANRRKQKAQQGGFNARHIGKDYISVANVRIPIDFKIGDGKKCGQYQKNSCKPRAVRKSAANIGKSLRSQRFCAEKSGTRCRENLPASNPFGGNGSNENEAKLNKFFKVIDENSERRLENVTTTPVTQTNVLDKFTGDVKDEKGETLSLPTACRKRFINKIEEENKVNVPTVNNGPIIENYNFVISNVKPELVKQNFFKIVDEIQQQNRIRAERNAAAAVGNSAGMGGDVFTAFTDLLSDNCKREKFVKVIDAGNDDDEAACPCSKDAGIQTDTEHKDFSAIQRMFTEELKQNRKLFIKNLDENEDEDVDEHYNAILRLVNNLFDITLSKVGHVRSEKTATAHGSAEDEILSKLNDIVRVVQNLDRGLPNRGDFVNVVESEEGVSEANAKLDACWNGSGDNAEGLTSMKAQILLNQFNIYLEMIDMLKQRGGVSGNKIETVKEFYEIVDNIRTTDFEIKSVENLYRPKAADKRTAVDVEETAAGNRANFVCIVDEKADESEAVNYNARYCKGVGNLNKKSPFFVVLEENVANDYDKIERFERIKEKINDLSDKISRTLFENVEKRFIRRNRCDFEKSNKPTETKNGDEKKPTVTDICNIQQRDHKGIVKYCEAEAPKLVTLKDYHGVPETLDRNRTPTNVEYLVSVGIQTDATLSKQHCCTKVDRTELESFYNRITNRDLNLVNPVCKEENAFSTVHSGGGNHVAVQFSGTNQCGSDYECSRCTLQFGADKKMSEYFESKNRGLFKGNRNLLEFNRDGVYNFLSGNVGTDGLATESGTKLAIPERDVSNWLESAAFRKNLADEYGKEDLLEGFGFDFNAYKENFLFGVSTSESDTEPEDPNWVTIKNINCIESGESSASEPKKVYRFQMDLCLNECLQIDLSNNVSDDAS